MEIQRNCFGISKKNCNKTIKKIYQHHQRHISEKKKWISLKLKTFAL